MDDPMQESYQEYWDTLAEPSPADYERPISPWKGSATSSVASVSKISTDNRDVSRAFFLGTGPCHRLALAPPPLGNGGYYHSTPVPQESE